MATYCTLTDVRNYAPELALVADEEVNKEILKAERDCDLYGGFGGAVNVTSGLRYDPIADLTTPVKEGLNRACCAQVQYRFYMGPSFFVDEVQYLNLTGDQGTKKPSRYGPQMKAEFPRSLVKRTGRAV